jgi:hypothetical protein
MHDAGDDATRTTAPVTGGDAWMTYREIAAARGITHAAAIRLVQRRRWQKREGSNDGLAHVLVPHDAVQPTPPVRRPRHADQASPSHRVQTSPVTPDASADTSLIAGALAALEDAVAALREAKDGEIATLHGVIEGLHASIARTEDRAGRAETDRNAADADRRAAITLADQSVALLTDAAARADRAEAAIAGERSRADALRDRIEALQAGLDAAHADARVAQNAADALRQAEAERRARGLVARLRAAWRGE